MTMENDRPALPAPFARRIRRPGGRVLIVAEIGTGHGGELVRASELIHAAAEAGADCAKFQCVYADEIIHPGAGLVSLPVGDVPLFEVFRGLERPPEFYHELKRLTERVGLLFLCSPFGLKSARLLRELGVEAFKIASPEVNHFQLLSGLNDYSLPVIMSTGVSMLGDIERALAALSNCTVSLLHCVTAYPAPVTDYNLRLIGSLGRIFGRPAGVSDHSLDPVLVPALAVLEGATIVEKHFCLSRENGGLDDTLALVPGDFRRMVEAVHEAETALTDDLTAGDLENAGSRACLERLYANYGRERVEEVRGDGVKRLAPAEAGNYATTRRSLHVRRAVGRGEILSAGDVAVLRSEKNLRPGMDPRLLEQVAGRRAVRDIPAGEGLVWDDLVL